MVKMFCPPLHFYYDALFLNKYFGGKGMKNYKKFILLGIIFSLSIPVFGLCEGKPEKRDLLMGVLEETGAMFLEGDIDVGGTIFDRFIDEEEMEEIGYKIKDQLELEDDCYREDIEEDGFIQLTVQGSDSYNNFVTFILSSYEDVEDSHGETSLFINFIKREQFVEFNDIIKRVENIFEEYDQPVDITTCIVGTFDEKFNLEEKEKELLKVTKAIKGKVVEQYIEDDILSFSIFTPYIEEYIYTGSKKMNLNIAIRFNEYEDKTYIWIGTPIITIGY